MEKGERGRIPASAKVPEAEGEAEVAQVAVMGMIPSLLLMGP